jgi:hypothetical protein
MLRYASKALLEYVSLHFFLKMILSTSVLYLPLLKLLTHTYDIIMEYNYKMTIPSMSSDNYILNEVSFPYLEIHWDKILSHCKRKAIMKYTFSMDVLDSILYKFSTLFAKVRCSPVYFGKIVNLEHIQ